MDTEIYTQLLRKVLKPNDRILFSSDKLVGTFCEFPKIWHGRLGNPGCIPGLYLDRHTAIIDNDISKQRILTKDLILEDLGERKKILGPGWEEINLNDDALSLALPITKFFESDTVTLLDDKHPKYNFSKFRTDNQYTIYRINYESVIEGNPRYRLRAGKIQFDADENQLEIAAHGPVRIFYGGQAIQLRWRSLKDEAEFYLLLGRYTRVFNKTNSSYRWSLIEARKEVEECRGDGLLKSGSEFFVVNFEDKEIGTQVSCNSDLILDI